MSYGWATVFTLAAWLAGYFIDEFISWDDPMGLRIVLPVIVRGCCIMMFISDSNQPKYSIRHRASARSTVPF